jgi:protein tyrosine/serine phosphatase
MKNEHKRIVAFVSLAVAIGLAGFLVWYKTSLPKRFAVVEPNVLYRSGQGKANQVQNAIDRYHIRTILCLREIDQEKNTSWLDAEKKVAEKNGVEFISWPMNSRKPLSMDYQVNFLKMTQDPQKTPILVHCAQGRHRTGFFSALYRLVIDGWPIDKTLNEMYQFKFGDNHPQIIDTLRSIDPESIRCKLKDKNEDPK